ncbi:MAG: mechanosensitive ion channel domain-containing protein [Leptospirales bacterium]
MDSAMEILDQIDKYWNTLFEDTAAPAQRIFITIASLVIILIIQYIINKSILRRLKPYLKQTWKKNISYSGMVLFFIIILIIWLPHLRGFFTLFGIIGTGILIATKEVIVNFLGWFYIVIRRPFEIGNRIMIKDFAGDVTDIRLLEFSMIEVKKRNEGGQSTGRIIRVPNGLLFTHPMANSSKEFSLYWNEIIVTLTPDSNWKKAHKILEQLSKKNILQILPSDPRLKTAKNKHAIFYQRTEPKIYTEFQNGKIVLTLRHLSQPKQLRDISDAVWKELLDKFSKHKDIKLT